MAKVRPIELGTEERASLEEVVKRGTDWRERERAETILLLAAGVNVVSIAERQGRHAESVRMRRRKWLKYGLSSLPEAARCGAPSKLSDEQRQQLGQWVESEALSSRELLTRLASECQVRISATTLRTELKRLGYVWKRTRYSLKKNETPSASNKRARRSVS